MKTCDSGPLPAFGWSVWAERGGFCAWRVPGHTAGCGGPADSAGGAGTPLGAGLGVPRRWGWAGGDATRGGVFPGGVVPDRGDGKA